MIDRREFIRPSSLPGLELCPGRGLMEARALDRCPELSRIENPQAKQGTLGHAVVAQTLSMIYNSPDGWRDPAECLAKMENALAGLEPWAADASRRCVNYAVALVDSERAKGYEVSVLVELHLPGSSIGISRGGTADVVLLCRLPGGKKATRVVIQDHKLGFLDQGEVAQHLQLFGYACMAYDKWEPEEVEIHLAQGRRKEFSSALFSPEAISGAKARIREVTTQAWGAFPEIVPGIEQCRYCKALVLCSSARERIMKASEEAALFGAENMDRIKLMEDVKLAKRLIEEAGLLQKEWVKTAQNVEEKNDHDQGTENQAGSDAENLSMEQDGESA